MTRKNISNAVSNISNRHIEEAADFYIGKKSMRQRFSMRKAVAVAAAIMLVFTMSVPTLAAADFDPAYDLLYMVSPAIAQKLKPVRMSCEDNDIKFEVVSASVEDNEALAYISVQDLDGDRIDETTDLFDSFSINTPFDCSSSCRNISYDADTQTATFLISISQWNEQDIIGDKITLRVREMLSNKHEFDTAIPELDISQFGVATETIAPAHITGGGGSNYEKYREDFHALVSTGVLCSPVEGVDITAVGYVDGKLHIQIKYESVLETDNHGYVYFKNSNGDIIRDDACIYYIADGEQEERYTEYIYDFSGLNVSEYVPYGYFVTSSTHISGNWSVTFPLEDVSQ